MRKTRLLTWILSAGLALALQPGLPTPATAQQIVADLAAGRAAAKRWCAECHLVAEGATTSSDVGPPFATLATDPAKTPTVLRAFLAAPHEPMPPIQLSQQDIENIVAYIQSLRLSD
ncbi:MAG: cytochrome c [Alphaproteobacteria bacterium]|nr:cytochrome c [Alphaproteobacteria bacterium]MDP6567066.1 cytochrome c [Alphaproteobacteria bacterium]MDP6811587.1 cytochrome c [Alphaproteobacteria bacterium]